MTNVTTRFVKGILDQLVYRNATLGSRAGAFFGVNVQPFLPSYLDHSLPGAYPHAASPHPTYPLFIQFGWQLPSDDELFLNELRATTDVLLQLALSDGQDVGGSKQIVYPNYANIGTPLSELYGENLSKLRKIREAWDPDEVMYLTGGFKL